MDNWFPGTQQQGRQSRLSSSGYSNQGANVSRGSLESRPTSAYSAGTAGSQKDLLQEEPVELKKKVGLISGISLIVGTMIGSGIFISPTGVAKGSGSVGLTILSWLICGIISTLGALCYAELGTQIPRSGAEYAYLGHAFGNRHGIIGPIPAFLFSWTNAVVIRPCMVAIIILAFSTYILEPTLESCQSTDTPVKCLAIAAVCVLMLINIYSVQLATIVQTVLTIAKIIALIVIIFGGFAMLGKGNTQYLSTKFENTESNAGKIAIGLYNGMWAYDGWNNLNYVTEEIINPYRNLPLAIMIGIPLVTVLYLLVNISYFTVMSIPELLESPAVAITWGRRVLGVMAPLIPVFVACSTLGAANGTLFSTGRLPYVAAREGHQVEILSMVHTKQYTPLPAVVFTSIIAIFMIIPGDIESLIDFFSFAVWTFYALTMVAFITMRFTRKSEERPFKVPIVLPIIVLIIAVYLVFAPIIDSPKVEYLYALIFILLGLVFYFPFVYYQKTVPGIDKITSFLQLLFEVSPSEEHQSKYRAKLGQSSSETTI